MNKTVFFIIIWVISINQLAGQNVLKEFSLPERGICAHRGANATHPENTLSAIKEAVRLGAHMIEFDVRMTKDFQLVVIHDETVDRTTDGIGRVDEMLFEEIRKLDAGSWKSKEFDGERVPAFSEVLKVIPAHIWINVHLKGNEKLGKLVARILTDEERTHQAFIACGSEVEIGIKKVNAKIMICNMERQEFRNNYVDDTIRGNYPFIQLLKMRDDINLKNDISRLKKNNVIVNYYQAETNGEMEKLFSLGVNFILTDHLKGMLEAAAEMGISQNY